MVDVRTKHFVFTLNNYNADELEHLNNLVNTEQVQYLVLGYEQGAQDTPHIQGFVSFINRKRWSTAKRILGSRVHLEKARGTVQEAAEYCKKDGVFSEFGDVPQDRRRGERRDLQDLQAVRRVLTFGVRDMAEYIGGFEHHARAREADDAIDRLNRRSQYFAYLDMIHSFNTNTNFRL
jgi:hypothetical protein